MSHSHLPVNHLLKQVEIYRAKRARRDVRPKWVTKFINRVAELFEPLTDFGRVGFDCKPAEDGWWAVAMYLGSTEVVGGPEDGESRHTNFEFDLMGLLACYSEVRRLCWSAFPDGEGDEDSPARSLLTIEGAISENLLRLQICSVPPTAAGPGFRQYSDGRRDPT